MACKKMTSEEIEKLVQKKYTQAAFGLKTNADNYIKAWKTKGYVLEARFRSAGPVVDHKEGTGFSGGPGEYVMVRKPKTKK